MGGKYSWSWVYIILLVNLSIFGRESDSRDSVVHPFISNTLSSVNFNHQMTLIINGTGTVLIPPDREYLKYYPRF